MGANLLTNPSFEANVGTPPTGWTVTPTLGGTAAAVADPFAFDQDNVLRMNAPAVADAVTVSQTTATNSFQEGEHAHFTMALRTILARANGEVSATITWVNAAGVDISTETFIISDECSMFGNDWKTFKNVSSAAPTGTVAARLELILDSMTGCTGSVLVDLVVLTNEGAG